MKKRSLIISLVLALALIVGTCTTAFAGVGPATEETRKAIIDSGVQVSQKLDKENDGFGLKKGEFVAESISLTLVKEIVTGKYKTVSTDELQKMMKSNSKLLIIDTMPAGWWQKRHIPGAVCQIVGADLGAKRFPIQEDEKEALLKLAIKKTGAKKVTKWYNKKTKKWVTKKPAKKYRGKSKKVWINKDKPIVVYCGFVGCARSHEGAKYLRSQGFKNVYRYVGGISAWVDAGNDIEGDDVK